MTQEQAVINEPSDYPQGYYHVYVSYATGHKPAVVDLEKLAELLPHGSGIDGSWYLTVRRNGDVGVTGEYHAMDENGYYCGWRNFHFVIAKVTKHVFHKLIGPCEGKVQVYPTKGDIVMRSFRGAGDASDYLYDTVSYSIESLLSATTKTVSLEAAKEMGFKE